MASSDINDWLIIDDEANLPGEPPDVVVGAVFWAPDTGNVYRRREDAPTVWTLEMTVAIGTIPTFDDLSPMTTAGDLILGGASGTGTRLPKGSDNDILQIDAGTHLPVWGPNAGVADILDLATAETDDTLVLAPDGAGGVEFRAEAGGGGGGAGTGGRGEDANKYNPDHETPSTSPSLALEMNGGSSGLTWSAAAPATVDDASTYPGIYIFEHSATTEKWGYSAWVPGSTDVTVAAKFGLPPGGLPGGGGVGIGLGNGTGIGTDGVMVELESDGHIRAYDRTTSTWTARTDNIPILVGALYLRMTRLNSGPTWRFYYSIDGINWTETSATSSKALTIGQVFIRLSATGKFTCDWIRCWTSIVAKVGA